MLPTFLVIGAQKAATTSLWAALRQHPQVFLPDVKEPAYFATEESFEQRADWYAALFAGAGEARARGEASTAYTMLPHYSGVADRIARTVPHAQLVYVVRDPVERMRSAYVHSVALGVERRPLERALLEDLFYAAPSLYATQLEPYLRLFGPDRLLLVSQDALGRDPDSALARVQAFLGVEPRALPLPSLNTGGDKRAPRRAWRALGDRVVRHDLGRAVPRRVARLNEERSPLVTRALRPEELTLSGSLRRRLAELFTADLDRLVTVADPGTAEDIRGWRAGLG